MKRITISLPDDYATLVSREARRRGDSVSEVIRRALASALGLSGEEARPIPFAGLGRSGRRHTARDAEAILSREWGNVRRR
jgi:Arc/MetJ-type ribon-helix-helix transcriptional regulator